MERRNILPAAVILASVLIGLSPFIVEETSFERTVEHYNSSATVLEEPETNLTDVGVNADPGMHFGEVPGNTNMTKYVSISVEEGSRVDFTSEGNITELLRLKEGKYVEGRTEVPVTLLSKEPGYYTGEVKLVIKTPENRFGRALLQFKERTGF